jgi:hypothetical protein
MTQRRDILHLPQAWQQVERTCSAATMVGSGPMAEKSRLSLPTPRRPHCRGPISIRTIFTSAGKSNAAGVIGLTPMTEPHAAPSAGRDGHTRFRRCKSKLPVSTIVVLALANGRFTMAGEARGAR